MRKIEITKDYSTTGGENYRKGETIDVSNNIAFGLIDKGVAKIFKAPENKIMLPEVNAKINKHNHYKIK